MLSCSRRAFGYFIKSVARLDLPHVVVVTLHLHRTDVVILTPETVVSFGV